VKGSPVSRPIKPAKTLKGALMAYSAKRFIDKRHPYSKPFVFGYPSSLCDFIVITLEKLYGGVGNYQKIQLLEK
jgi:hypothetical protein